MPTNKEIINVVIHDAVIAKKVLTIALVWPSSIATAELNDGYKKKNSIFIRA